ncbi:hypothetical protein VS883_27970, partial [Escherichia coli]
EDEPEKYTLPVPFYKTMTGYRTSETRYIAFFEDGTQTPRRNRMKRGIQSVFLYLEDEPEKYTLPVPFYKTMTGYRTSETRYIAFFED